MKLLTPVLIAALGALLFLLEIVPMFDLIWFGAAAAIILFVLSNRTSG